MANQPSISNPLSSNDFDLFSHYYDLDQGDIQDDIQFHLDYAHRCGEPILELGCGTGRLLLPLASEGFRVTGIEIATTMLAIARQKVRKAGLDDLITLIQGDMRGFQLPSRFSLAICALNTIMHLPSLEDQFALVNTVRSHLKPGGLFLLDLLNPHTSALSDERTPLLLEKEMLDPESGNRVFKLYSQRVDLASQVAEITLIYDEIDQRGRVKRTLVPTRMRWLYPYEARLMLEAAGLRVEAIFGSYDLEPYHTESERLLFVAYVP